MFIRVSHLIAISFLCLVGCSETSNNKSYPVSPSSSDTSQSTIPTDQPSNESMIVGKWQSRSNHTSPMSGNYEMITTIIFHSDGTYEYSVINTSDPNLGIQRSGQWSKLDGNIISANINDPNSDKIYEHKFRIVDQNTIVDSYGKTSTRLP